MTLNLIRSPQHTARMMVMSEGGRQIEDRLASYATETKTSFDIVGQFIGKAPVELEVMAAALGLRVNLNASLENGASGRIARRPGSQDAYLIEVNGAHSHRRKRFTLAHEIAHYLLHRDKIGDGITDDALYRSGLGDYVETEANRVAAQLLMPAGLVRSFFQMGMRSISALCQQFDVSEEAMRIRLQQLRLGV